MPIQLPVIQGESRHLSLLENYIELMQLDGRNIEPEEFLLIEGPTRIKAFGRLKQFDGYNELCTLGVVDDLRKIGLGAKLVKALCKQSPLPLYLVCIIPEWFRPLGFEICLDYPENIKQKLNYCTNSLVVEQAYVVMRYQGPLTEN